MLTSRRWNAGQLCGTKPTGKEISFKFDVRTFVVRDLEANQDFQSEQGWGVSKMTFIDNATVSYSNPVRQPLYNFEDCVSGATKKATRAARALKEVYPGIDASGIAMSVPMAGHPIINEEATKTDFETLKSLIDEHDVICQLMDSRESRWLPTVMGKASGKIVMNAALGFDTFVVMRHGVANSSHPEQELGCYFCNDVVAPADVSNISLSSKLHLVSQTSCEPRTHPILKLASSLPHSHSPIELSTNNAP